jgi:DNA-binding NtrC family response regulator
VFGGYDTLLPDDIDRAVELFRHSSDTGLFGEAKYLKGVWLSINGHHGEAREVLVEAYASFLRCGQQRECAEALNRMSYVSFQLGHVDAAIRNSAKGVEIYEQLGDTRNQLAVIQNLCMLQFRVGRLHESIAGYTDIESQIPELGDRSTLIYREMSAIPHALQGDIKAARKIIARCKPFLDDYPRERAIYFENLGLIDILDGKYSAAEKVLQKGLKLSLEIAPESALISQIKRLFGDLYIATEQWDKARKFTDEALQVAEKIGQRVEIAACYRIFAQIAVHDGDADKAREWFVKAIELFQLIGSNYELAVTRYLAGVSGLHQNGERHAILWMARRYFESEQVKPYLKKIDKALASGPTTSTKKSGGSTASPPIVIAKSKVMTEIVTMAEHVAPSNMTVFLTGETGTGKDLLARYIHCHSDREGEFVSVNAAAIPGPMIESELFGHTAGAFTGADGDRVGLLQQADHGTFYLNEIADATMEFQTKLLEVLETREIRRLGENKNRPASFRLIAATNHDLKQRIAEGQFRLDLYHRLNQIPIELPSLSSRTDDIPALVAHFLGHAGCDLSQSNGSMTSLAAQFCRCTLTGNVRQLQAEVQRLWLVSRSDLDRMIELVRETADLDECEYLRQVLIECDWNRRQAARRLSLDESTVRRRMKKHGLTKLQLS